MEKLNLEVQPRKQKKETQDWSLKWAFVLFIGCLAANFYLQGDSWKVDLVEEVGTDYEKVETLSIK